MRLLILSDRPAEESRRPGELERFGRFVDALRAVGVDARHEFTGDGQALRALLRELRPDWVFCASLLTAPGPRGREVAHALLESEGRPYVGPDPAAIALCIDKAALKARWVERGIRTPPWALAAKGSGLDAAAAEAIGFPCIVKPGREGNSRGIGEDSVVRDARALRAAVDRTVSAYGSAIAERFLGDDPGLREFTVALIGSRGAALVLPAEIRLRSPKAVRVVTTADKDEEGTLALPVDDAELRERLVAFAAAAFAAAGVRDYSRCDVLLSGDELHAIEINGQPMVPDRWFAACAAGAGLDEAGYLAAIVLAATERLRLAGREGPRPPESLRRSLPAAALDILSPRPPA